MIWYVILIFNVGVIKLRSVRISIMIPVYCGENILKVSLKESY